jgi:hypothetical protein
MIPDFLTNSQAQVQRSHTTNYRVLFSITSNVFEEVAGNVTKLVILLYENVVRTRKILELDTGSEPLH